MFPTIRRLFSSRQVANTAPRSKRSRGFPARKSVKLMLEILEDRLAPTINLSYSASLGTLTVAAANSTLAPATIEVDWRWPRRTQRWGHDVLWFLRHTCGLHTEIRRHRFLVD